ncbi:MAG TPA: DNA polymerase III subunit epsilon, partial [Arcobacter skirrowii]|nr:DNA polymerase III subunit epsilon [Aliarcobacter skirrowii]
AKKDPNYLNWMRNNMELDEDMQYTLDKVLEK